MFGRKKYDIGIIGSICSVDFNMAKSLSELGARVVVFQRKSAQCSFSDSYYNGDSINFDICTYDGGFDFFKKALSCGVLFSFTGAILGPLKTVYPLSLLPIFPPVVNISTGSDMSEFIAEGSIRSFLYRLHLRLSAMNWLVEYPHGLKNIIKYKIPRAHFMPFPAFRLPENKLSFPESDGPLIFFHPSHLDWKHNDNNPKRNSTKGNDRFIKAFIKAVQDGLDAKCILLNRGPDKDEAKKIINESGMAARFIWREALSRDELFQEFSRCHVVVDQFDVGGLGGIAIEAMASGRPVMMYIEENCSKLQYGGDLPPVLNCWGEDDIYARLMECNDRSALQEKAESAYNWAFRQHRTDVVYDRILFYVYLLSGNQIRDYGWSKDAYSHNKQ